METPKYGDFRSQNNCTPIKDLEALKQIIDKEREEGPTVLNPHATTLRKQLVKAAYIVEKMQLPTLFSSGAWEALDLYTKDKKELSLAICDALTFFPRTTVMAETITQLYPYGFYNEDIVDRIFKGEMVTKRHEWYNVFNRTFLV